MTEETDQTESPTITTRKVTALDQFVQILEISFIFLLTFSIIALIDTTFNQFDFYRPIANDFLGNSGVGPLNGGNFEEIVRITLIFNLLLFSFSLFFGLWIRRTRDKWSWKQLGYTLNTDNYTLADLIRRGFALGLVAILIWYVARGLVMILTEDFTFLHAFAFWTDPNTLYTPFELRSEYYFGIVEMGFIWPVSAGFFFFAYAHNSLNARFPTRVANIFSTFFYVFYLQFFFLISSPDKINQLTIVISQPLENYGFWIMSIALWIVLYIMFAAFAETKSIVLPFLTNFVFNVGITLIQAANTLIFKDLNLLMIGIYVVVLVIVIAWYYFKPDDFSTLRGETKSEDLESIEYASFGEFNSKTLINLLGFVLIFIFLSFFLPGWINEILYLSRTGAIQLNDVVIPTLYAINFAILIALAVVVLTYEPTNVFDVLLVSNSGTPIATHIELFETDEVLISGYFTAIAAVDKELSKDTGLKSIKRGQREILIEEGVSTRLIALADRDQPTIRQNITNLHRNFEITQAEKLAQNTVQPTEYQEAQDFVQQIANLSITFSIPQQTKWIGSISILLAPLMIILIGLL